MLALQRLPTMRWPRKVFVESTALFQLGPRLENVDFARLLEMRDKLGIELYTTEVNFHEYLRFRKRETSQTRSRIVRANQELEKYAQNYGEFDTILGRFDAFTSTMNKTLEKKFQAMGINVLPLPKIDIQRLLHMSIEGVPPFEKPRESLNERSSEKGFRDALIMFTILEAVRGIPDANALVVTDDDLLADGFQLHSKEFETVVNCVANISLANKFIQERVSATIREALRAESEEAKAVLLAHRTAIEAKVSEIREIEATDFGLFGIVKDKHGASLSVESVLSVKFEDIEAAIWKDVDKPRSTVLFKMRCEAKVIVSNPCVPQFGFPKYQIGGGTKVYSTFSTSSETQEKIVPLSFYGQATLVRKGTEWVLEEIRIDRSMPSLEDYFELAMVRAPAEVDKLSS
jgi:PIN domain